MTPPTSSPPTTGRAWRLPKTREIVNSNVISASYGASTTPPPAGFAVRGVVSAASALYEAYIQPDVVAARRHAYGRLFAQVVANLHGVEEVWLDSSQPVLRVVAITRDLSLERELELRGIFISLTDAGEPEAELSIFAREDDVPDWAREGELLT